ncbi:MAG: AraC family transcriptional regulator [Paludibacteraceae bacterium]|nr:AraC family transcriptional regulator [Paludibacteraceae bacterium]
MRQIYVILLTGAIGLCACNRKPVVTESAPEKDSIAKVVTGWLLQENYVRATEVIDSADAAGWLTAFDAQMLRLRVTARDDSRLAEAQAGYEALLEGDLTQDQQMQVLTMLTHVVRYRRDDQKALEYGARMMELCRQMGHETQALTTQSEIGSAMIRLGRTDEGLTMIEQSIVQLDSVRRFRYLDACILTMKSKIRTLIDLKRYEEVIPVGERMVAKLGDFADHPEDYADGSPRLPSDKRRPGYVDFYTGQAYAFITYAYASLSRFDEAKQYSRLFDQTNYSRTYAGRKHMATGWGLLGEYERMNAVYQEMAAAMGADTINHDYSVMLYNFALEAQVKGRYAESAGYWRRYASLQNKLNDAERVAAAQESAARYHEQEQQYAIEKEQTRHKRDRLIQIALIVVVLLIALVALLIAYQWRIMRRKNAVLSREIAENINYKEKYLRLKSHPDLTIAQKDAASIPSLGKMSDAELYEFLRVVIAGEQLYLNPSFERRNLMDRFGLSKDRIGAAFSQGGPYSSLAEYVNECRLGYSATLLATRPDLSISEIAAASGFANSSVFSRNFKEHYTITPSEFRKEK